MCNLKRNDTNEFTKEKRRLTNLEDEFMVAREEGWGEGVVREFWMDVHTLLYLK